MTPSDILWLGRLENQLSGTFTKTTPLLLFARKDANVFKTLSAPIMVSWEVTPVCNHNCLHCYNFWREEVVRQKLPEGFESLFSRVVEELISNKVFTVVITGGEPLEVIVQIAPFVKALSENGIWVCMNSNLSLMDSEKAQLVKDCGIRSVLVSIPSADPKTCDYITQTNNSLARIERGISVARQFGLPLFTNMVVSRINKHQVGMTAEWVALQELKHFSATRAADPSSSNGFAPWVLDLQEFRAMQQDLEEAGKKYNLMVNTLEANPACAYGGKEPIQGYRFCSAGRTTCTVGFEGKIRPCNRTEIVSGHIVDGLMKSWLEMDNWRSEAWTPSECSKCSLKVKCNGGCKVDAIKAYGTPSKPDPLCDSCSTPTQRRIAPPKLTNKQRFIVNSQLRMRSESFGAILCIPPNKWVPVGRELAQLFVYKKEVSIEEIQRALGVESSEAVLTASFLLDKCVLS